MKPTIVVGLVAVLTTLGCAQVTSRPYPQAMGRAKTILIEATIENGHSTSDANELRMQFVWCMQKNTNLEIVADRAHADLALYIRAAEGTFPSASAKLFEVHPTQKQDSLLWQEVGTGPNPRNNLCDVMSGYLPPKIASKH